MNRLKCENHLAHGPKEKLAPGILRRIPALHRVVYARSATVLIILCVLLASGCAPKPLSVLGDDTLNRDEGYESVLFWRLRVEDKTDSVGTQPKFFIYRPAPARGGDFDRPLLETIPAEGEWTKQNGVAVYEAMTFAASRPGDYLFGDVVFPLYTNYVPNYYTGRYEEREVTLNVPVSRLVTMEPGKLAYLGTIVVELLKEEKTGYAFRVRIDREENDYTDAVRQFRDNYPGLFKRFNRTVAPAFTKLLFIDRFSSNRYGWSVPPGDRHVSAYFSDGKYVIESKNDGCHWAGFSPPFDRPQNFDIELVSASKAKSDAAESGLALGTDRDNAYNFFLSPGGQAKVELYKDGDSFSTPVAGNAAGSAKAPGAKTVQKVEVRGDTLRYFVDDRLVGELKNELSLKDWFLGLAVCGRETADFDQLRLIER